MAYLEPGFELAVRSRLGVDETELPDADINNRYIAQYAEARVLKRVPGYADITDDFDKLCLENSIISYICYLLCPSLARRVNIEVTTIDVRWKKDKTNWSALADAFLADVESNLSQITTVEISGIEDYSLGALASYQTAT